MKCLNFQKLLLLTFAAVGLLAQTASALITIDFVPVGNAGNAADPTTGYGAVGYSYGIGKYEVTLNQYTAFLNSVAKTDTYGLYNSSMGTDLNIAGISRSGFSGSYTYSVIGSGARPVTYVSWYDSARFVNWLGNGQPTGAQAAGTTETGAYTLVGNTVYPTRNADWVYGLPTGNEWYKAAYHQPVSLGGDADNYWLYPTANNAQPNAVFPNNSDANSANFANIAGGITEVGAYTIADSFYGTFDQGGNVWERNDEVSVVVLRGGSWASGGGEASYLVNFIGIDYEGYAVGFRVAVVPEPSVAGMIALGITLVAWKRK